MVWYSWDKQLGVEPSTHHVRIYVPLGISYMDLSRAEGSWLSERLGEFLND